MFTAAIHFTGNISVGSLLTAAVALIGLLTVYAQTAQIRERQVEIHDKIDSVDRAVNGKALGEGTLRENVQDLHNDRTSTTTINSGESTPGPGPQ
jgi:hypothetical protein